MRQVWLKAIIASVLVAAPVFMTIAAEATAGITPLPTFNLDPANPGASRLTPTKPGETTPAQYVITNTSNAGEVVTVDNIRLIPSCGSLTPGCPVPDLGVFQLNGPFNVVASSGAICPTTFTISVSNAITGEVLFTPNGATPVLSVGQSCGIVFTTTTLRVPTSDAVPGMPGVQTAQLGFASGTSGNGLPLGAAGNFTSVDKAAAAIGTVAAPQTIGVGQAFSDTATVTGATNGPAPTGTVTFKLFGPTSPGFPTDCSGTPFDSSPTPVPLTSAGGVTATAPSGSFGVAPRMVAPAGKYVFVATYSGDVNYLGVTSGCGDTTEQVTVQLRPSAITTAATPQQVFVGTTTGFADSAIVTGTGNGPAPTGTVTFQLFGPTSPAFPTVCTGTPFDASTPVPLSPATATTATASSGAFGIAPRIVATAGKYVFVASYSGDATYAPSISGCSDPTEQVTVSPLPTIVVDKSVIPGTLPEPGGTFRFSVVVRNTSPEAVTITTLTDDIYGDLISATNPKVTNNTCAGTSPPGALGKVLALDPDGATGPLLGGTYSCAFDAQFIGNALATQTDTVTSTAVDAAGNTATDTGQATVTLTDIIPTISVDKSVTPGTRVEPGGTFRFTVVVRNTNAEAVTITSLVDDKYGNLSLATLPKVTNNTCAGSAPTGALGQVLALDPDGAGPLLGGAFTCSFDGQFTGVTGDSQTDIVTSTAVDDDGNTATDTGTARVVLSPEPVIAVTKTATPGNLPEPGGTFRFAVVVRNTGAAAVTITALTDDKYGDLASATNPKVANNTCAGTSPPGALGKVLDADTDGAGPLLGGSFSCAFDGVFMGNAGDSQIDVVTSTAVDSLGTTVTATDDATVTLTNVPPTVKVVKTATPESKPAPGGAFTFKVVVTNTSVENVTITALTDDVYGNIATKGTCTSAIGTVLAPQATYSCSFTGDFAGASGSQKDVVTVTVIDDDKTTATAVDDATVTINPKVTPPVEPPPVVTPRTPTAPTVQATTLARTGASLGGLLTLAVGLLAAGGLLLLAGSGWAPTVQEALFAGTAGYRRRRT